VSVTNWVMKCILILTLQSYQQVPHAVQKIMSKERTPVLCGAIYAFEMFMSQWERMIEQSPCMEQLVQPGLELAYKYYGRMDNT